jgi:NitT/TauT family transport system substrate-binding protein
MKRKMIIGFAVVSLAAVTAISVASAAIDQGERTTATIKAGGAQNFGTLPIYLARQKGYFRQAGLDVVPNTTTSATATLTAVVSGALQIGTVNVIVFWNAVTQGLPVIAISPHAGQRLGTDGIFVRADSAIRTAKDLEGKTHSLASLRGTNELFFRAWMEKRGADPSKVNFVALPGSTALSALRSGRVDSSFINAPFTVEAKRDRQAFRFLGSDSNSIVPFGATVSVWIANPSFVRDHPEDVRKFVQVMLKTNKYANTHPREAKATLTQPDFLGVDAATAQATTLGVFSTVFSVSKLQRVANAGVKYGFFNKQFNVRDSLWPGAPIVK